MNSMYMAGASAQPPEGWSIRELAERTGITVSSLRMWETRYQFPRPARLDNGHRRYTDSDIDLVREVIRRRACGVRLEIAIRQVTQDPQSVAPPMQSIFATLRASHPGSQVRELRKRTLLAMSWAIEDELSSRAERAQLFGAFQSAANYSAASARWVSLAQVAASTHVFADFTPAATRRAAAGEPHLVRLSDQHPMRREWAVVCDGLTLPIALSAREIPGQERIRDGDRLFEAVWTVEPGAVRTAARSCARAALAAGSADAANVLSALESPASADGLDATAVTNLVIRVLAYVDRASVRDSR